ncbi:MAG: MFS transporter [Porphyromonadaceae bacterium]|jgi:acyl-[acyl-carrier-protein]-phospholipid O-acyltransferase/long-chain-fatty-acid--[acyl-carrier-protein] ligase|nr:MFS transporter [Porphyromonadaceae bacterium]
MQLIKNKWISLFTCNFLGVFNDNFLKNGILFVAIAWTLPSWLTHSQLIAIIGSCLVLPYLIFSPLGGRLSVRYSKLKVFQLMKLLEMPIMFVACIAFYFQKIELAIISMLLMGIQSSLYSPSKYSLIRDIGGEEGVSFGSGVFETMAFLGILFGTYAASVVSDNFTILLYSSIILGVALLGFLTSKSIKAKELPAEKSESETLNPIKFVRQNYHFAKRHRLVNSAVFGSSSFWLISNLTQMNTIIHCKNTYHVSNSKIGLVMAFAAIGIALGTSFTGKFSGNKVQKGLIIPALIGMTLCLISIIVLPLSFVGYTVVITLFALLAGVFQVPCMAIVQQADLKRRRGDTFAYLNMMNFLFILISAGLFSLITALTDENSYFVFGVMGILTMVVMIYFLRRISDFRLIWIKNSGTKQ